MRWVHTASKEREKGDEINKLNIKQNFLHIWTTCKNGWNELSWFLTIVFGGTVLFGIFGVSESLTGMIVVLGFLYAVGRWHPAIIKPNNKDDLNGKTTTTTSN